MQLMHIKEFNSISFFQEGTNHSHDTNTPIKQTMLYVFINELQIYNFILFFLWELKSINKIVKYHLWIVIVFV